MYLYSFHYLVGFSGILTNQQRLLAHDFRPTLKSPWLHK